MDEKKKTGLGASAFFQRNQPDERQGPGNGSGKGMAPRKRHKLRTTITLYEETLAAMELLKVEARKGGHKATLSDVLEEAVKSLMEKKQLQLK